MLNVKKFEIPSKATYKLDRIRLAAALTDHPELGRKTILVAGTNGKGSTCAYLTAFLMASGCRVGTYSSPHVVDRGERIRIDGEAITEIELRAYEKKYARVLQPLTYFERFTLLGFLVFRDRKVDVQILEVGLGGRLDATNISDPDLSVISRIDYDHEEILGKTLTKIATEKSGIMRLGRPVVVGRQASEASRAIQVCAKRLASEYRSAAKMRFSSKLERGIQKVSKNRGVHQADNLRLAIASFQTAMKAWALDYRESEILKNLSAKLWPARIQMIRRRPLFVVDGSHNMNSIDALRGWLKRQRPKKWNLIFGVMVDKHHHAMIRSLKNYSRAVYLPTFYPERQMMAEDLKRIWIRATAKKVDIHIVKSLSKQIDMLWVKNEPVLVVGSLYLAGAVLSELRKKGRVV